MYFGSSSINLDAKGRMAFPAKCREKLLAESNGSVVVTLNPQIKTDESRRSLVIYSGREWKRVAREVSNMNTFDEGVQDFQRFFLGNAAELEMDGSGRILLPSLLRDFAGLDKKLILLGQNFKFELWDEGAYMAMQAEVAGIPDAARSLKI